MNTPPTSLAAVFEAIGKPIALAEFPLVDPPPGHILGRVRMATICGSDLHTISGRRTEPAPLILGHEIVVEAAKLGEGVRESAKGVPLKVGDRLTFTIMASCGRCATCRTGLPQKCESLFKYGHTSIHDGLPLSGGFAEYVYLRPGTAVFHVPEALPDELVCPANCALATVINGLEAGSVQRAERVLVQGAGPLGLYATALLKDMGASEIVVTDIADGRLEMAQRFGADRVLNVAGLDEDAQVSTLGERRFHCVLEVCGNPAAVRPGIRCLGLRGRYVIIGLVCAGSDFSVDGNTLTRNYLTIRGIHNYAPRHLERGLEFLERTHSRFPYEEIVSERVKLRDIGRGLELAKDSGNIRVAVVP